MPGRTGVRNNNRNRSNNNRGTRKNRRNATKASMKRNTRRIRNQQANIQLQKYEKENEFLNKFYQTQQSVMQNWELNTIRGGQALSAFRIARQNLRNGNILTASIFFVLATSIAGIYSPRMGTTSGFDGAESSRLPVANMNTLLEYHYGGVIPPEVANDETYINFKKIQQHQQDQEQEQSQRPCPPNLPNCNILGGGQKWKEGDFITNGSLFYKVKAVFPHQNGDLIYSNMIRWGGPNESDDAYTENDNYEYYSDTYDKLFDDGYRKVAFSAGGRRRRRRKKKTRKKRGGMDNSEKKTIEITPRNSPDFVPPLQLPPPALQSDLSADVWYYINNHFDQPMKVYLYNIIINRMNRGYTHQDIDNWLYQVYNLFLQQQQSGGSRTFTTVKDFFKYLNDNKEKSIGKGNEKHGQYLLHKKMININTKTPHDANFKFRFEGYNIRRDMGYQQFNLNLTREILRHVLVFKLLETNQRSWRKHIGKNLMFPISHFLTSHRWPNENIMSQPIKIKGLNDHEWWTLNFRDNHEIVSLNENMPRRNNTIPEEIDSERGPQHLGLWGQEVMPGRSQGTEQNDEPDNQHDQPPQQQQGGHPGVFTKQADDLRKMSLDRWNRTPISTNKERVREATRRQKKGYAPPPFTSPLERQKSLNIKGDNAFSGGKKSKKVKEMIKIFQQYPDIFPSGYFRFLGARLENHLKKKTILFKQGVILTWIKYQKTVKKSEECIYKPGDVKLDQIVNKNPGNGKAKKVMLQFLKKNKNNTVWLEVKEDNKRAIDFYERNGFEETCSTKFGDIKGIIMKKSP